jgi:hypothetical protein
MSLLFLSLRSKPLEHSDQKYFVVQLGHAARYAQSLAIFPANLAASFRRDLCPCFLLTLLPAIRPLNGYRARSFVSWNRIIAPASERIATQDSPKPQCRSIEQTVLSNGFCCVFRTTGHESASDR